MFTVKKKKKKKKKEAQTSIEKKYAPTTKGRLSWMSHERLGGSFCSPSLLWGRGCCRPHTVPPSGLSLVLPVGGVTSIGLLVLTCPCVLGVNPTWSWYVILLMWCPSEFAVILDSASPLLKTICQHFPASIALRCTDGSFPTGWTCRLITIQYLWTFWSHLILVIFAFQKTIQIHISPAVGVSMGLDSSLSPFLLVYKWDFPGRPGWPQG